MHLYSDPYTLRFLGRARPISRRSEAPFLIRINFWLKSPLAFSAEGMLS
jgi:hypothetical protein